MTGVKRLSDDESVETAIGSIAVAGVSGEPIWELGRRGSNCYGFYRSTSSGRMWWAVYTSTLEEAEAMMRSVARTYGWRIMARQV